MEDMHLPREVLSPLSFSLNIWISPDIVKPFTNDAHRSGLASLIATSEVVESSLTTLPIPFTDLVYQIPIVFVNTLQNEEKKSPPYGTQIFFWPD
jgi:hypothetical protein